MSPAEALTRLHAAGRIRSAWLPGMRDERGNLAIVTDKRGASAWFPPWFDYEPLPSVRLPPDVGARAGAVQEAPPVGAWVVVGFALVRYS